MLPLNRRCYSPLLQPCTSVLHNPASHPPAACSLWPVTKAKEGLAYCMEYTLVLVSTLTAFSKVQYVRVYNFSVH